MSFDQSINPGTLVRSLLLKCALPVILLAAFAVFVTYWTDQAYACAVAIGMFFLKWICVFFEFAIPYFQNLASTSAWKFLSEYILLPLRYVMLPLAILFTSVLLVAGCALNKMKRAGMEHRIYELIASNYQLMAWLYAASLSLGYLVEADRPDPLLINICTLWVCSAFALISCYCVEKVNGDLFKWKRKHEL